MLIKGEIMHSIIELYNATRHVEEPLITQHDGVNRWGKDYTTVTFDSAQDDLISLKSIVDDALDYVRTHT